PVSAYLAWSMMDRLVPTAGFLAGPAPTPALAGARTGSKPTPELSAHRTAPPDSDADQTTISDRRAADQTTISDKRAAPQPQPAAEPDLAEEITVRAPAANVDLLREIWLRGRLR